MPCMRNAQTRAARRVSHVPAAVYFRRREQIVHGRKACEREERKRTKCRPLETLFWRRWAKDEPALLCIHTEPGRGGAHVRFAFPGGTRGGGHRAVCLADAADKARALPNGVVVPGGAACIQCGPRRRHFLPFVLSRRLGDCAACFREDSVSLAGFADSRGVHAGITG